jgi:hypothetical protein
MTQIHRVFTLSRTRPPALLLEHQKSRNYTAELSFTVSLMLLLHCVTQVTNLGAFGSLAGSLKSCLWQVSILGTDLILGWKFKMSALSSESLSLKSKYFLHLNSQREAGQVFSFSLGIFVLFRGC